MPEPDAFRDANPPGPEEALLTRIARRQGRWPTSGKPDEDTEGESSHTWSRGESDGLHSMAFGATVPWPPGKDEPSDSPITRSRGED